jgi:uncharacterized protein (TIGR00661 family)
MNILYSVQATGNGHISRAMELLPHFREYGNVDVFLSGDNSALSLDEPVKYRSKGLSLYYNCTGGLDYWRLMKGFRLSQLRREVRDLPVEKYDLVLNDFEYITAAACAKKNVASINFGHQASFQSVKTPRPQKKSTIGEYVLKNYATASRYVGLHFKAYDDFILTPIIKKGMREATPADKGHITVYLPSYCEQQLETIFSLLKDFRFEIFCTGVDQKKQKGNIVFLPVHKKSFDESFINCHAIITGGGFETPAEALHLGKKMICIPIRGQYEQRCNIAALQEMGVTCLSSIGPDFSTIFYEWINSAKPVKVDCADSIPQCLDRLFSPREMEKSSQAGRIMPLMTADLE